MTTHPPSSWTTPLRDQLNQLHAQGLSRSLQPTPLTGNFSHNDYLGLARHPAPAEAAARALRDFGTGARAARLLSGNSALHRTLEQELADFKQTDAALLFPSGYTAALGVIPALLGPNDFVLLDRFAHACLFDAARLSGATIRIFAHNSIDQASILLQTIRSRHPPSTRILLVTESLFSMDGDFAPLPQLVDLKDQFGAWLLVDEAHATGILGPNGRGAVATHQLSPRIEVQLGTLSKAIGVSGGFIAGHPDLINLLLHRARTFLFTTGTPPALAAAASASLAILRSPEGDQLRTRLHAHRLRLLQLAPPFLQAADHGSPILPWIVGPPQRALRLGQHLAQLGFHPAIVRPPTVPARQARLRFSLSAAHTDSEIDGLAAALHQLPLDELHQP